MKKPFAVLAYAVMIITVIVLSNSCKHERPPFKCEPGSVNLTLTKTDANAGQKNGTITATVDGGKEFTFSLNGGAFQSANKFTGLAAAANYKVVAKNELGCSDTALISIGTIDPCAGKVVSVTATKTDATLNQSNGSITATGTGGTGFTYSLNNGAFQASGTFNNLATGNYTVTAKNSDGCIATTQVTIGTNNPCAGVTVTVNTTKTDPTTGQSNGSITATATGGTGFTYSLNNGAFQASGTFNNLATGNYTITAKNSNGCTGVAQVALGSANPCAGITVTVSLATVNPVSGQSNGSITATATGGTGFTYSLNNGAFQASGSFTGLAAGNYTVTVKNSNGCLGTAQATLTATNVCANTTIVLSTSMLDLIPCSAPANNGSITVTASGSTGFMYNLNNGAYQASNIFSNLAAATYTVGVKDVNGCTKTASAVVGTKPAGPLFGAVKTLITTRCAGSGCHTNGGNAAGYNFDTDCKIVNYWSQINGAAVTYTLKKMPIGTLFTAAEKKIITDWISAGHGYGN